MKTLYAENLSEYKCWSNMKQRCFNPNATGFSNYGGLGITVCERWRINFSAFLEDMGKKPQKEWQIHRINGDGDYEPSNCIWIEPIKHNHLPRHPYNCSIKNLTKRQAEILEFIASQELTPSIREIGNFFNITVKGAYDHIKALEKKKKITMQPNKARSIAVIPDSEPTPTI